MAGVGAILSKYFVDKQFLSSTTIYNPPVLARLMTHLDPYVEGASLTGAGGGGFMVALLKPNLTREDVVSKVRAAMSNDIVEQDDNDNNNNGHVNDNDHSSSSNSNSNNDKAKELT